VCTSPPDLYSLYSLRIVQVGSVISWGNSPGRLIRTGSRQTHCYCLFFCFSELIVFKENKRSRIHKQENKLIGGKELSALGRKLSFGNVVE
jgi:hypothetical protein